MREWWKAQSRSAPWKTGGWMIYTRPIVVAFALFSLHSPCDAASQRPSPVYTKNEIDVKLGDLRTEMAGKTQSIAADINAKLQELRELVIQSASKSEVDAKINAIQQMVTAYKKVADDQIPSVPLWVGPLVSIIAAAG